MRDDRRTDTIVGGFGVLGSSPTPPQTVVEGGTGADQINGTDAEDIIIAEDGDDTIRGANGDDFALMGAGNDTFLWLPGDDNDVVEGQAGIDTLAFQGAAIAENFNLMPNGGRLLFTRNIGSVVMDTNDVETLSLEVLGGTDNVTVDDLSPTDVTKVDVDLEGAVGSGTGDTAADMVTVNGTAVSDNVGIGPVGSDVRVAGLFTAVLVGHSEAANDTLKVNTVAGDDMVTAGIGLAAKIMLTVDGGLDGDTIQGGDGGDTLTGGDGNDSIRGMDGNDFLFGGPGIDFLNGGAGADTFSCGGAGDTLVTDPSDTIGADC